MMANETALDEGQPLPGAVVAAPAFAWLQDSVPVAARV
jgi:hypothetical protein